MMVLWKQVLELLAVGNTNNTLKIVDDTNPNETEDETKYNPLGKLGKIEGQTSNGNEVSSTVCLGIDTRDEKISIVLESGANIRISVPSGESFYLQCDAERQHGIYARFA